MEKVLLRKESLDFGVGDEFKSCYLAPIIQNVLDKAENGWDDYNEIYHACKLIENVKKDKKMRMDFHFIKKAGKCLGIVLITGGDLNWELFFNKFVAAAEDRENILILNAFHIAAPARGNGRKWLREIILPYYKAQGFRAVYLKSSHPLAFPFYSRLGVEIGGYTSYSDNNLFERKGKIFKIALSML